MYDDEYGSASAEIKNHNPRKGTETTSFNRTVWALSLLLKIIIPVRGRKLPTNLTNVPLGLM